MVERITFLEMLDNGVDCRFSIALSGAPLWRADFGVDAVRGFAR